MCVFLADQISSLTPVTWPEWTRLFSLLVSWVFLLLFVSYFKREERLLGGRFRIFSDTPILLYVKK